MLVKRSCGSFLLATLAFERTIAFLMCTSRVTYRFFGLFKQASVLSDRSMRSLLCCFCGGCLTLEFSDGLMVLLNFSVECMVVGRFGRLTSCLLQLLLYRVRFALGFFVLFSEVFQLSLQLEKGSSHFLYLALQDVEVPLLLLQGTGEFYS